MHIDMVAATLHFCTYQFIREGKEYMWRVVLTVPLYSLGEAYSHVAAVFFKVSLPSGCHLPKLLLETNFLQKNLRLK